MVRIQLKVGKGVLTYEAEGMDIKSVHRFSSIYGMLPNKCDVCEKDDIFLSWKSPSGNDYYTIVCNDCGAELAFHQKKEGGFYLIKGEKMEVWQGNSDTPKIDQFENDMKSSPEEPQKQSSRPLHHSF